MGYSRQTFEDNKTILTASHLNHIEDGIIALETAISGSYAEDTTLITQDDYILNKFIEGGVFASADTTYRIAKFQLEYAAKVQFKTSYAITRTDRAFCFLVKYTDNSYTTHEKIIIQNAPTRELNETIALEAGFYAVSWNNDKYYGTDTPTATDADECVVIAKGKNSSGSIDGETVVGKLNSFASIDNSDLTLSGTASRDDNNVVVIGGGSANKAQLTGDFQGSHFSLSARFMVDKDSDFSFIMGKGPTAQYGFYAELVTINGVSYCKIYKDLAGSAGPTLTETLDFVLNSGEEYLLRLTFDIVTEGDSPSKNMTTEIFGEYNEYYSYTTKANAYGVPFYYSNAISCTVYDFRLSVQHYYDIQNAKAVVFGHSFVEGDSLGIERGKAFAYLLETELGKGRVLNLGLGGDSVSAMSNKISNSIKFIKNCEYALLGIGTNDRGLTSDVYISRLQTCINKIEEAGLTPILFTIPHANYTMTEAMIAENEWIRSSGYHYVDMYKVFANSDGSCKTELFLADKIHPSVAGHQYILNRIKMDCPFLF